mgnify:FL=1
MEIIFLTNDVGSLGKDKKKGNQNVVFSLVHHSPGTAVKDAVDVVVSMIEHKADEFFEVGNKLPLVEADFLWYFELLKKVIRSNWSSQVPSPCIFFFLLSHAFFITNKTIDKTESFILARSRRDTVMYCRG